MVRSGFFISRLIWNYNLPRKKIKSKFHLKLVFQYLFASQMFWRGLVYPISPITIIWLRKAPYLPSNCKKNLANMSVVTIIWLLKALTAEHFRAAKVTKPTLLRISATRKQCRQAPFFLVQNVVFNRIDCTIYACHWSVTWYVIREP